MCVCVKSFVTIANNMLKYIPEVWEDSDDLQSQTSYFQEQAGEHPHT